jgi:hypothetical protein
MNLNYKIGNMLQNLKKIFFTFIIAAGLPAAALASQVELQLQINPAATPAVGNTGGSGSSSAGGGQSNVLDTRQTNLISGWTSPNSFVEAIIDDRTVGTATAAANGSFTINTPVGAAKYLTVHSTDVFGALAILNDPIGLGSGTGTITNVLLPPSLSMPSVSFPTGAPVIGSGRTVPGGTLTAVITPANGKTITAFPVVGSSGDYKISLDTKGLPDGAFTLQISVNFGGKSETTIINGTIGKVVPVLPPGCNGTSDLNCDNKVNLQDVSILLKFFGAKQFPAAYDLNHDGKINLVDLSIMLYYLSRPARTALTIAMVESTTGPTPPVVMFDVGQNIDGEWLAAFSATSEDNEIQSTEISIDSGRTWRPAESPYRLGMTEPTSVLLRATDDAGNAAVARYRSRSSLQMIIAMLIGALVAVSLIGLLNLISRRCAR